ncbi:CD3324 family protein [Lysinibacillus fusiformis]|uniref:CD3324 family protein n=1 Tax=Lysinibacillus fusiformis TaxID=28031 RepID=UPI0004689FEB|nr:CD3324 family protein [Lysinibacillus fusiformis]
MSYKKAKHILPEELLAAIQEYIDGEYIYIPRKDQHKKSWGSSTTIKAELDLRNANIYHDFLSGMARETLGEKYYLSRKSIQRIILKEKRKAANKQSLRF